MRTNTKPTSYDVAAVLEDLGISVASEGEREITAQCPFHEDRHPSFSINAVSGLWICFQCGAKGTLEQLISQVGEGMASTSYLREVRTQKRRRRYQGAPKLTTLPTDTFEPSPYLRAASYHQFRLPPAWACEDRFFSQEIAERYELKWDHGWIIPIWSPDRRGTWEDLWGWQFKRLKFVSNVPMGIKKSETVFGLAQATGPEVTLVESPLDVVRLGALGVPAVASYGAFVSGAQRRLLVARYDRVIVALDNDEEGRRQGRFVALQLGRFIPTRRLVYPDGTKDPGDFTDDQVRERWGL